MKSKRCFQNMLLNKTGTSEQTQALGLNLKRSQELANKLPQVILSHPKHAAFF